MRTVRDILKNKSEVVWSIDPKAKVFEALTLMGEKEIGALMVIDGAGTVYGIVSERDYARKVILKGKTSRETAVEEIMTPFPELYTVKPDNTVEDAMVVITGKKIRHLPVFEGNRFIGLISIGDVVKSIIAEQESLIEQLSNYISGKYL
ncbi:MAG: inosine 5'-monophosphate dehydrogenase [Syntrophorhabdaceae bacterium PtaU1.Bin034]|jgi:CBS domain-containing protein|nr:MAG: inosine 5'-monophosphate dehydrogenase [Syntrophorhabdaceae bacterium PtaU1.Bin034]